MPVPLRRRLRTPLLAGSLLVLVGGFVGCGDKDSDDDDDGGQDSGATDSGAEPTDSGGSSGDSGAGSGGGTSSGSGEDGGDNGGAGEDGGSEQTEWVYEGEGPEFSHDCGSASSDSWTGCHTSCSGSNDHITYGPYAELPAGTYIVTWKLKTNDADRSSLDILQLDVTMNSGSNYLANRRVNRSEFPDANVWTEFSVSAEHIGSGRLEFRTQFIDSHRPCVSVDWVRVTRTD
jgi:hypothetical protein